MGKSTFVFSDTCLCCGAVVPEGTQVCSFCMKQDIRIDEKKNRSRKNSRKPKDLAGQKFGRLTAVRRLDEKIGSCYAWLCRCDCGQMTKVSANALLKGGTKSCGCGRREAQRNRFRDISGQRFGRLLALEPVEKRQAGGVVWKCRCDCGKETEVSLASLTSGNTKSCGCLLLEHESPGNYLHYVDGTCVENLEFKGVRKNNTSGYTGVMAYRGKWKAQIVFKKKRYHLGTYETFEEAVKARQEAEQRVFGEFLEAYYGQHPNEVAAERQGQKE